MATTGKIQGRSPRFIGGEVSIAWLTTPENFVNHNRFRCNNSTLDHDLFIRNRVVSLPLAPTATHMWKMLSTIFCTVECMLLIALQITSAPHLLGDKWLLVSDKEKIE